VDSRCLNSETIVELKSYSLLPGWIEKLRWFFLECADLSALWSLATCRQRRGGLSSHRIAKVL